MRIAAGEIHIGSIKRLDSSEILPVTVEEEAVDIEFLDGPWDHLISEVDHRSVGQQVHQNAVLEQIDSHRR